MDEGCWILCLQLPLELGAVGVARWQHFAVAEPREASHVLAAVRQHLDLRLPAPD